MKIGSNKYTITGYKTIRTLDGGGFSAFLHLNGVKFGEAVNTGDGGPTQYLFYSAKSKGKEVLPRNESDKDPIVKQFQQDAVEYYENDPVRKKYNLKLSQCSANESFIEAIIEEHESLKKISRYLKTNILVKLPTHTRGQYALYKRIPGLTETSHRKAILEKNPQAVFCDDPEVFSEMLRRESDEEAANWGKSKVPA